MKLKIIYFGFLILMFSNLNIGQTIVFEDPLIGSSKYGTQVGGTFTSEGYRPLKGTGHILYVLPYQVANGYLEFQIKGFTPSLIEDPEQDADNGFFGMYDGRGINEPIQYFDDFKTNFFRWNLHYRQNKSAFKSVIQCSAPTSERLNATKAVFGYTSDGLIAKDWGEEPTGSNYITNSTSWYTVRAEWNNKTFTISINGTVVWEVEGPYDYAPIDHRIWLGSAPGTGDKYTNSVPGITYRNLKIVTYGIVTPPDSLNIIPQIINASYSSGESKINISSNVDWNIQSNDNWINVTPTVGNGDDTLFVSYEKNDLFEERIGNIIVSGGSLIDTIKIIQEGKPLAYIDVHPAVSNVEYLSGQLMLSIDANVNWNITSENDWVSFTKSSGTGIDSVVINYKINTTSSERTATITVSNDSISTNAIINQKGSSLFINISPKSWNVAKYSGDVSFYVESNLPWSVKSKSNWLVPSINDTIGNVSFLTHYTPNTDTGQRIGVILIENEYFADSALVIQEGATPFEVTVNILPEESGSVNGYGIFGEGSTIKLLASPNLGWKFDNWSENDLIISTDTLFTFKLKANRNFVANFSTTTDVNELEIIPNQFSLSQNYPNPFNPSTQINFDLPEAANVKLTIYNLLGQEIKRVFERNYSAGSYEFNFDGYDLTSGIYIYSIHANGISGETYHSSRKMMLVK